MVKGADLPFNEDVKEKYPHNALFPRRQKNCFYKFRMGCRWGISTPACFGQSSELPELVLTSLLSVDDKGIYSGTVVVDFYFYSILFWVRGQTITVEKINCLF